MCEASPSTNVSWGHAAKLPVDAAGLLPGEVQRCGHAALMSLSTNAANAEKAERNQGIADGGM